MALPTLTNVSWPNSTLFNDYLLGILPPVIFERLHDNRPTLSRHDVAVNLEGSKARNMCSAARQCGSLSWLWVWR